MFLRCQGCPLPSVSKWAGLLVSDWSNSCQEQRIGDGLVRPEICFNGDQLLLAGEKRMELYAVDAQKGRFVDALEDAELEPIAAVAGEAKGQFAVLSRNREVCFYERS